MQKYTTFNDVLAAFNPPPASPAKPPKPPRPPSPANEANGLPLPNFDNCCNKIRKKKDYFLSM